MARKPEKGELVRGDYINTRQGEGYVVAELPTGDYVISMKKRDKEGRRVNIGEISKVWRDGRWEEFDQTAARRDLEAMASRLAAEVLVGALECLGGSVAGEEGVGGMEARVGASGRVLRRKLDGVGWGGVRMVWTVAGDAMSAVSEDAKGMAKLLGTKGEVVKVKDIGGRVVGTMPWSRGQGGMTWDDVVEVLDGEGLLG